MRTMESLRKLNDTKKDARLTIRIPRELKAKIDGIDQVYGVALPKIANECLRAFCDYVEQKKQTPTFPLTIGPYLRGEKTPKHASLHKRRGIRHRQKAYHGLSTTAERECSIPRLDVELPVMP
jgi:hypothetical protein